MYLLIFLYLYVFYDSIKDIYLVIIYLFIQYPSYCIQYLSTYSFIYSITISLNSMSTDLLSICSFIHFLTHSFINSLNFI